jgi:hypothetical protein
MRVLGWDGASFVSMSHPSLRTSAPIACNRHVPCPTQSASPIQVLVGRWVARSSAIGFAILSETSYTCKFISSRSKS